MSTLLKLPLSETQAKKVLRACAASSEKVFFTTHAQERMVKRGISRVDVLRVLERGSLIEGPYETPNGDWKLTIQGVSAGSQVTVAVAIKYQELLEESCCSIIITAYE